MSNMRLTSTEVVSVIAETIRAEYPKLSTNHSERLASRIFKNLVTACREDNERTPLMNDSSRLAVSVADTSGLTLGAVRSLVGAAAHLGDEAPMFTSGGDDGQQPTYLAVAVTPTEATETDNDAMWDEIGIVDDPPVPTLNDWERMVLAMVYAYPNKASAYTIANVIDYRDVGTDEAVGKRATATLEHLEELGLVHGVYSLAVCADAYDVTAAGGALAAAFPVAPAAEQYDNSRSELLVRHAAGAVTLTDIEIRILDIIRERQDADPPRYLDAADLFVHNVAGTIAEIRDALHHLEDQFVIHVHTEWHTEGTTTPEQDHEVSFMRHTWELTAIGEKIARTHASRA